jgi:hypothetical protein
VPVCRIRDRNVWEWIWDPFVGGFGERSQAGERCGAGGFL